MRRLIVPGRACGLLLVALIPMLIAGCGEREFEPDEFVDAANEEGAGLVLGDSLTSITEEVEVFSISFEGGDGGGSLIVTGDSESAAGEFARCENAVTLTCYRAANVVVYFDATPGDESIANVDAAIRALGDE